MNIKKNFAGIFSRKTPVIIDKAVIEAKEKAEAIKKHFNETSMLSTDTEKILETWLSDLKKYSDKLNAVYNQTVAKGKRLCADV